MQVQRINILHISDLHYSKSREDDHKVILRAFFDDLRQLSETDLRPNLVVFSGDLVLFGDDDSSFYDAISDVIEPVLQITGLDEGHLFITPGNHDVQRAAIKNNEVVQQGLETALVDRDKLNEFYSQNRHFDYVRQKLRHFLELREYLSNVHLLESDLFFDAFYIRDLDIALASVNTAWMSRAGLSERDDRQRLLVPEASVRRALSKFPDTKVKILLSHHPADWLAEYAQDDFRRIVEREFTIHLHGHMHDPISAHVHSTMGNALVHQSGALYTGRKRYNGYAIISVSPEHAHAQIDLRSFFEKPEQFDAAVDIVPTGRWYSSPEAKAFWAHLPRSVAPDQISKWVAEHVGPELEESLDEGFTARPVSEVFVAPRLSRRTVAKPQQEGDELDDPKLCPMSDLVSGPDNFLIVAKPEFGKSTLLRQIALGIIRNSSASTAPAVPCLFEFSEIKPGRNRFKKLLRFQLPHMDQQPFTFDELIERGCLVILIDDVELSDNKRLPVLLEFIDRHPRNRFILTTNAELFDQLGVETTLETAVPFTTVYMEPFRRRDMRQLVERWDSQGDARAKESLLDRLVKDIVHINVPLTPVNGTILLTIFESHGDFTPINRAVLIQLFIETLLEKHSLQDARRERFDFRNKVYLLSHIAFEMTKRDDYLMDYAAIQQISSELFKRLGLPDQSDEQIGNFISAKILEYKSGKIRFRYRAFLEYFIAERMRDDDEFKNWILDEERYLSFGNEIEYVAGIKRNDLGLLELVGKRFSSLGKILENQTGWIKDLNTINELSPPHDEVKTAFFEGIERQLQAPPLTTEERDELLEAELPRDVGNRQEVFRPLYEEVGEQWTGCLLLYSRVLKNSELVPDHHKREHFSSVLGGWAQLTYHAVLLIPALVKHRRLSVNGVVYHVLSPESASDGEVARGLYLALPRSISDMINIYLATEKMEIQFREPRLDDVNEPLIVRFYRGGLYGDLKLKGFLGVLRDLETALKPSPYLSEAFIWKLRQMLMRLPLSRQEDAECRKLIAHSVSKLLPGSAVERQQRVSKEMHRLDRGRLLRQLRIQARERAEE